MIRTTKKIDVAEISKQISEENLMLLELGNIQITTNDTQKKVYFSYTETPFLYEESQREVIIDNIVQLDDNNQPLMETYQKVVRSSEFRTKKRSEDFTYDEWFAIRSQIEPMLPDGLSDSEKYLLQNEIGLKAIIVQKGYYKGKFTNNDFE